MGNKVHNSFYTPMGLVDVEFLAHGSIHIDWEGMQLYVDPCSTVYDFTDAPKADVILITHAHGGHYDCRAIEKIATPNTTFVVSKGVGTCIDNDLPSLHLNPDDNKYNVDPSTSLENMRKINKLKHCKVDVLKNGDNIASRGLTIYAVPAYNINNKRSNGHPYHIKGEGNGYILDMQGFRMYFAGDTEMIPEMKDIKNIDIAFMPKNEPYTMSDEEFVKAANLIAPKNLFPVHYAEIDPKKLAHETSTGICLYVNGRQY
ncbi:MAG: MBL fold metallo-hydrolase [Bacteroidales bacterium]|jgi:L-ascorbate metabolism protein UlaG (beta-lactamase superfamily)|nr:MBL fold metallo-hydrolase [Bacteroidales bacterium]MDD4420502.1 MBL fold metallo-hydrolase [Bacteroidales bacterium]